MADNTKASKGLEVKPKSDVYSPSMGPSTSKELLSNLGGLPAEKTPQQVREETTPKKYKDAAGF